ncbi:post-GPI attachment to proteins factor 2 [Neocloeon triangulifer]|uniref:post-GPI attachment to proteins factor 2 n=1 Tax=Neocloeon triangulifer TaxID=2078957 RepID=UPI00286EDCA6|nr:post-GPI attachment to proteins factor 2 [Neocloeon triangulifer]XP_059478167.1 post-GPI attachment to proteins factor 2 [Neocloeon triangulifer]
MVPSRGSPFSKIGYLPLNEKDVGRQKQRSIIFCMVPFESLAKITVALPLLAFIFCIVWSVLFHFETTVSTHCKVSNWLPSISAAIGNESPQKYVWMFFIALHAPTRFLVVWMYVEYFWKVLHGDILWLAGLTCLLNFIENVALLGLTFFTSAEHYPIHEKCFITFIATSELYMILSSYLLSRRRSRPTNNIEGRSLSLKVKLLIVNVTSFMIAGYFFVRHNNYCEPYVYTLFALFEYIVVVTNMGYHMTASYDLFDRVLHVGCPSYVT